MNAEAGTAFGVHVGNYRTDILFRMPILVFLLFIIAPPLHADELIVQTFWVDTEPPFNAEAGAYPQTDADLLRRVLDEAVYVFSGMIYGFDFRYVPADAARGVAESFDLTPTAQIPWGDPSLSVLDSTREENRFYVRVQYALRPAQEAYRARWSSSTIPICQGHGEANVFLGIAQRLVSVSEAVKNAIRERVRSRVLNRPQSISGTAIFESAPRIYAESGAYQSDVSIRLDVSEITPYEFN